MKLLEAQKVEKAKEASLEKVKEEVSHRVQEYKYAKARVSAAETRVQEASETVDAREQSVARTRTIFESEKHRLDLALAAAEKRMQERKGKLAASIEADEKEFEQLKKRYADWQVLQKKHAEEPCVCSSCATDLTTQSMRQPHVLGELNEHKRAVKTPAIGGRFLFLWRLFSCLSPAHMSGFLKCPRPALFGARQAWCRHARSVVTGCTVEFVSLPGMVLFRSTSRVLVPSAVAPDAYSRLSSLFRSPKVQHLHARLHPEEWPARCRYRVGTRVPPAHPFGLLPTQRGS